RAFTHVLFAGSEFAPTPSVFRVSMMPPTFTFVWAPTTVRPVLLELSVIWQLPLPSEVWHGFGDVNVPGPPLSIVKLICVPSGAGTKPTPSPLSTFTCAVNVCVCPTRLVAFDGEIWMFAST